jgi:small subunit ribosomal protein S5
MRLIASRSRIRLVIDPKRHFSSTSLLWARRRLDRRVQFSDATLQKDLLHDAGLSIIKESGLEGSGSNDSVRVWNDPPPWRYTSQTAVNGFQAENTEREGHDNKTRLSSREMIERYDPKFHLPIAHDKLQTLHRYPLIEKRVVHQTGKGRIAQFYALTVVGNGRGLMGYGEGKGEDAGIAREKSFVQAVRSLDTVDRFENRTLWSVLDTKFSATKVIMRPRPVGFGLRCNPNIHQVCKAAGIKDISAKVWGSRNPMNVIKATCKLLHGGSAPLNMGDGIGGKGRRLDKGSGMRGRESIELERGRKISDYRTW